MKSNYSLAPLAVVAAIALLAVPRANANLIENGDFGDGTYTSTVGGNTNANVPVDWVADANFDLEPGFNDVRSNGYLSTYNLSIGNYDWQTPPSLSQTFSDNVSEVYTVSFFLFSNNWDSGSFFEASVGGSNFLDPITNNIAIGYPIGSYTLEAFTFVGTGSDTLVLTGNDTPGEWYVSNVSVTGTGVPDQGMTVLMLSFGLAALGFFQHGLRRRAVA